MTSESTIRMYAYISPTWVELNWGYYSCHISWGISDNSPNSRVADIGELTVSLNNYDGIYSPDSPTALAGWKRGIPFKMVVTFEGEDFVRFRGNISEISIKPNNKDKKAYITVLDWLDYSSRHPIVNPGIQSNKRGDEVITTVLGEMAITPVAESLSTGYEVFPNVLDTVTSHTKAYNEFAKVAMSELGMVYVTKDRTNGETLVFRSSDEINGWLPIDTQSLTVASSGTTGFLKKSDGGFLLKSDGGRIIIDLASTTTYTFNGTLDGSSITDFSVNYGNNILNKMTVTAHPRRLLTESVPKTIELDIDSTAQLADSTPETNFADGTTFGVGEYNAGTSIVRTWIKPTFKRLPSSGIKFLTAKLRLVPVIDQSSNSRNLVAYRCLRTVVHNEATWNTYDSDIFHTWGSGGASDSSTDYDGANQLGSLSIDANPVIGAPLELEFTTAGVAELQKLYDGTYTNNGILIFMETQVNDQVYFAGVNNITPGYKPVIIITYYRDVLFSLDKEIIIGAGETVTIKGNYSDPDSGLQISAQDMVTPVANIDYSMFTGTGSTGTNITTDLELVDITYGTEGFTHQVKNNNERVGYISRYSCRGVGIIIPNPIEYSTTNYTSSDEYGFETDTFSQKYKNNLYSGRIFADSVVEENKKPRTVLESITFFANKNDDCMLAFLFGDVGQLYHLDIPEAGVSGNYYIHGIDITINGKIVMCKWIVRQSLSLLSGLETLAVEFDGGTTDGINYGYLPKTSNLTTRSWSAWIYMDNDPASREYIFGALSATAGDLGASEYGSGYRISAYTGRKLEFFQAHTGTSSADGIWRTPANSIPLTTWTHILITHDTTTPTTAPIIYINGVAQTLTTVQTPVGSVSNEEGNSLVIGNNKSTVYNYDSAFDGKIYDPCIYKTALTSGNATTLYNSGTPDETLLTSGLVFQGFNIRSNETDLYIDVTLTDELKIRDNMFGAVGTPHGTPIGRTL